MSNLTKISNLLLTKLKPEFLVISRNKAKLTQTTTQTTGNRCKGKHRGWKKRDGNWIKCPGEVLATQNSLRWHPGLNVGLAKNATLFALVPGRVVITCEKANPDWDHSFIKLFYEGVRNKEDVFYKKYFNIIPEPQHKRFKLIDTI